MKLEHNFIRIQKKQKSINNNRAANEISAATKRRKAKRIKNCAYWGCSQESQQVHYFSPASRCKAQGGSGLRRNFVRVQDVWDTFLWFGKYPKL